MALQKLSLKELIELCVENKLTIGSEHHGFIDDMSARLGRFKDATFVSPKQMSYLRNLLGRYVSIPFDESPGKPKSRLEELKAKKQAMMHRHRISSVRAGKRRGAANRLTVQIRMGELQVADTVTAKMRHDKSLARQLTAAPLLITQTKKAS